MLTGRGWWFLIPVLALLGTGLVLSYLPLILPGLTLLLWFVAEWLLFAWRAHTLTGSVRVKRELRDDRGEVRALWTYHVVRVRVAVSLEGTAGVPFAVAADLVPFAGGEVTGTPYAEGPLTTHRPLRIGYRLRCRAAGTLRFEGVRLLLTDLQGFFYHSRFLRDVVEMPVLPRLVDAEGNATSVKRFNLLPPPGIHRFLRPGSGSELLDLRDYLPGDPPKTIAWKVSARRDRLITKEFESEVPIRCTLFVDASSSVRVPFLDPDESPTDRLAAARSQGKPLDRLVEIAAAVLQATSSSRDLTGLCLFDEQGVTISQPDRSGRHLTQMYRLLAEATGRSPTCARIDPDRLTPLAYAFADAVYPDLLHPAVNHLPFWMQWVDAFPGFWRSQVPLFTYLFRRKQSLIVTATVMTPLILAILNIVASQLLMPRERADLLLASWGVSVLLLLLAVLVFLTATLLGAGQRRLGLWRKRLAALLALRQGTGPAGLAAMLEDNDLYVLRVQEFLNDHQVPYPLPLYDEAGRYLYAAPGKIDVLSRALLRAVRRGRDNELFVLLVDLLELEDHLGPLLAAVRVAMSRHHQVVLVCPWPPGLKPPPTGRGRPPAHVASILRLGQRLPLVEALRDVTTRRFHAAYARVRQTFARLGVAVVCAASEEPVPLILERIDRLRTLRTRR
jgi:uncharacterized protein (DUF58 family)